MTTTETSLRVRFAAARGWKLFGKPPEWKGYLWKGKDGRIKNEDDADPTDANTVRDAWMTLTPEEKRTFVIKLKQRLELSFPSNSINEVLEKALDIEPSTLAELYCEVKFGK